MGTDVYLPVAARHEVAGHGELPAGFDAETVTIPQIAGNNFAVLRNNWQSMLVLSEYISDRLLALGANSVEQILIPEGGYPGGSSKQLSPVVLDEFATRFAGTVFGLGN